MPIYSPALLDELRSAGVRHLVLNSWFDGAFAPVEENERYFPVSVAEHAAFRARLEREGELLHRIEGFAAGRIGPDIEVWRLR